MSKTLDSAYYNSIVGKQVLTLNQLIKITLKNGTKLGFTNYSKKISFANDPDNLVYSPRGFVPSALSQNSTLSISNLNINLLIDGTIIKMSDLEKNKFNDAKIEIREFNWMLKPYNWNQQDIILEGNLGEVKRSETRFDCEFLSKTNFLQQTITDVIKSSCSNNLGDSMCQVNLIPLTFTDTIATITSQKEFTLTTLTNANDYFNNGTCEIMSGNAVGEKLSVKQWILGTKKIIMNEPFIEQLQIGDQIKVIKGCMKNFDVCKNDFNNRINYNGFPKVPGQDFLVTGKGTGIIT